MERISYKFYIDKDLHTTLNNKMVKNNQKKDDILNEYLRKGLNKNKYFNYNDSVRNDRKLKSRVEIEADKKGISKAEYIRWCVEKVFRAKDRTRGMING